MRASSPPAERPSAGLALSRSTATLFSEHFETADTTQRVDRIASARERDLRHNRFATWGGALSSLGQNRRLSLLSLLLAAVVTACSKQESPPAALTRAAPSGLNAPEGNRPVDPALLAFLDLARASHHRADIFEGSGRRGEAMGELEELVRARSADPQAPEVREVLADTFARLADLRSR